MTVPQKKNKWLSQRARKAFSVVKTFFTLTPRPGIYSFGPWWCLAISFVGLYGTIHLVRLFGGEGFFSTIPAFEIGDPILCVGIAFIAAPLKKYRSRAKRFYHRVYWYAFVAVATTVSNALMLRYGVIGGLNTFSPLSIIHFILVPIYATLIIGVIPHLLVRFKDYYLTTGAACASFMTYAIILVRSSGH